MVWLDWQSTLGESLRFARRTSLVFATGNKVTDKGAASEDPSAKGFEAFEAFEGEGSKGRGGEKFNEHFRALTGLHNASNNQMLKQSCNQLPDAITRSRIFCDHLSQCAMVVGVLTVLRNQRERAMYSNTVPWPMHLGQWPHSLRNHFIR